MSKFHVNHHKDMGRGSKSSEVGVRKERQKYSQTAGSISGAGSQGKLSGANCLFTFKANLVVANSEASGINKDSPVVIVPHYSDAKKIDLFIENINFGLYDGRHKNKIVDCIKEGYVYEGTVQTLNKVKDGIKIGFFIQGRGR